MTPDEMTTTLAEVLAEHATYDSLWDEERSDEYAQFWKYRCKCGRWLRSGGFADQSHRAHLAAVLAATVTEAQAGAWDEGYDACTRDEDNDATEDTPNPYRARADSLVDRAERGQR